MYDELRGDEFVGFEAKEENQFMMAYQHVMVEWFIKEESLL
jgi:hypothetical protein